jgi:hypothetical protein
MRSGLSTLGFLALLAAVFTAADANAQDLPGPADDGIEVHGHWTVTVVRDGQVVERREFHNDLQIGGRTHLAQVLTRETSPGPWIILVEADGTGTLCADNEFAIGEDTDCTISESSDEVTASPTPDFTVLIEGTETVVRDANITDVHTFQRSCTPTTAPADCQTAQANRWQFTRRSLDTPIAVLSGDRIEVTVEISFS